MTMVRMRMPMIDQCELSVHFICNGKLNNDKCDILFVVSVYFCCCCLCSVLWEEHENKVVD